MKFYAILLSVLVLSSCASMSKEECVTANWGDVGIKDGSLGRSPGTFDGYVKACAKASVTPDKTAYLAGRFEGLKKYCTIQKGYELGQSNSGYSGVCADHNEAAVLAGRKLGLELYAFQKVHEDALAKVEEIDSDIEEIENEISKLTTEMNVEGIGYRQKEEKNNLIASSKINLSVLKHTRYLIAERADEKLKLFNAEKKRHVDKGYCSSETCFAKK